MRRPKLLICALAVLSYAVFAYAESGEVPGRQDMQAEEKMVSEGLEAYKKTGWLGRDSNDDILAYARKLVEEKRYAQAIDQYRRIQGWLRHDPGLVIEFARVYTYADRHAEAIGLFEEARAAHPEREAEILRELGDQYKWNGDLKRSIEAYQRALGNNPGDTVVKDGLAEALLLEKKRKEAPAPRSEVAEGSPRSIEAHPPGNDDILAMARHLVEQHAYAAAIDEYKKMDEWLRHDTGLVIEFARVYTYADMHPEAIALFEEVRAAHPEREAEILRELGDQYKWNGDIDKAIGVYEKALKNNPDDTDVRIALAEALVWKNRYKEALSLYDSVPEQDRRSARVLISKADALSLMDRLEAADRAYQQALEADPGNLRALNGRAKVKVWQGYHKEGARRYRDILRDYPDNIDALEGLAYALHWDGQDAESSATASRVIASSPRRKAAGELLDDIKQASGPYAVNYDSYWNDKNKLSVQTHGMRVGLHPDSRTMVEGIYEWQKSRQKGYYAAKANRAGVGVRRRLADDLELNSYSYGTHFDTIELTTFTTSTWLTWWMDDMWRFDMSYNRSTFTDVGSILNKIIIDAPGISVDLRPNRYWLFSGSFSRGFYSDTNIQNTVFCKAEYRLTTKPVWSKLYYNYYYSGWSKLMNYQYAYFNPRKIDSHSVGIYASKDITKRLFVEGQGSVGYEYQTPKAYHPTYYMGGNINYRIADNWIASLKGDLFKAYVDTNSNGYSRAAVMLTITYMMGAGEPAPAEMAHSASRPITGR